MILKNRLPGLLILLVVFTACHRNPLKINVSKIDLTLNINRLDQGLASITPQNIQDALPELKKKTGPFFEVYAREILAIGSSGDSLFSSYLLTFLRDSVYINASHRSDSVYRDFEPYSAQLRQAFRHYLYYYPELTVPAVYTYISGYNQSVVTANDAIGISLDNYLGAGYPDYRRLGIFEYKRRTMEPAKLVYDVMYAWAFQEYEYKGNTENLVSNMIYQGKLLYFVDAMIPEGPDSLKIGFTKNQMEWCKANESVMWSYLIENKSLFSGDRMESVRFINPAPFTTPFGQKSPGRSGVWIGWQIVKSYMKKNPEITLKGMMEENDYHKILNESGYAPL
jgi:gliding motility-associated lipoprotein GldB